MMLPEGIWKKSEVKRNDEIGQVSIAFNAMVESINTIMSELRESENKFRNFADQSLVGINLIQDGVFKYVNPKFADIFGYTVEQCLNNMKFVELVYPDDLAIVEENIRRRLSGEAKQVQYEFRGIRKTGEIIHVEIFGSSILFNGKPAATATLLDITERKRAEEALESEHTLLRNLIDNVPDRIYAKDSEGRFIICNEALARRMGMTSPTELVGKSDFDFLPPEMAQQFRTDEQAIIQSGTPMINREEPLMTEGGTITRWNLATKVPLLDKQGNRIGIVGIRNTR